jgi:hypothetical protein
LVAFVINDNTPFVAATYLRERYLGGSFQMLTDDPVQDRKYGTRVVAAVGGLIPNGKCCDDENSEKQAH